MAKSNKVRRSLRGIAKDAATLEGLQNDALRVFSSLFADIREKRAELVTPEVYNAYKALYRTHGWLAAGHKSANFMYAALLKLADDVVPNKDPEVKAEANFATYVLKRSPLAQGENGKRKSQKRKPDTTADVLAYVKEVTAGIKPGSKRVTDPADVAAIYAAIRAWAEMFAQTTRAQEEAKAA